jgi:hypothetical protein
METKEIAMSKHTQMLGTVCVLAAALAAGPAAADTLTGFAGTVGGDVAHLTANNGGSDGSAAGLGGSVAGPLSTFAGLNAQADVDYQHEWGSHFSAEDWNFGGSAFFAAASGRAGVNVDYFTETNAGSRTSGGAFGEYYFNQLTLAGKGGYNFGGGAGQGGHGNYLGAALTGYLMPDLSLSGAFNWNTIISGQGSGLAGRSTLRTMSYSAFAEWEVSETFPLSITLGYSFNDNKQSAVPLVGSVKENTNVFWVGLKWYTGGGSLEDHHRSGTLMPWLTGSGNGSVGSF